MAVPRNENRKFALKTEDVLPHFARSGQNAEVSLATRLSV